MKCSIPPLAPNLSDQHNREARDREEKFILDLRKEATELKDCFTKFSFQGLSIAVGTMIFILRFQHEYPLAGLAAILPIVLLLAVCSMGTHKYAGVNRLLGYELHLERTRVLCPQDNKYWKPEWRMAGWEEAMRA